METYFIYADNEMHDPPAERGSVEIVPIGGGAAAYAGSCWGEHYLSGRAYCIAWDVRSTGVFDEFLSEHGYERVVVEE
ncbi:hypothetical protein ACFLQV_01450 [Calditrichota bacterium]